MPSFLQDFWQHPFVTDWGPMLALIVLIAVLVRLGQKAASQLIGDKDHRYRIRKAIAFVGFVVGSMLILAGSTERLGHLAVLLGGVGAGVAFALQEVIISVAGWIAISFGGFYKVGDRVQVGGIKGDVVDIGVLRTTLAEVGQWVNGDLYNGRMVRVANSFVFKEPVVNYSGDFPFLWDELVVPIKLGSDLTAADEIMREALDAECSDYKKEAAETWDRISAQYRMERAGTEPMVSCTFDENWISYTLRYCVRYDRRRSLKDRLSRRLLSALAASGERVEIAGASLEVVTKSA